MYYGQNPNGYGVVAYNTPNNAYMPQQQQYGNIYGQQQQMAQNNHQIPQNAYPQQQQVQQAQYNLPIREIRFVTSEEAKAFIVMPNSNALLIDTTNGTAFLKSADSIGQSVTKTYKFTELGADGAPIKPTEKKPEIDVSDFVKRADIDDYIQQQGFVTREQYKTLQTQLDSLKREISVNNDRGNKNGGKQQQQG